MADILKGYIEETSHLNLLCKKNLISEINKTMNMEAKVCNHFRTGYCKYGKNCRKQHIEEVCDIPKCSNKSCNKRHPKVCKYFFFQQVCKFGDHCLYKHSIASDKSEIEVLIQEVNSLKATVVMLSDTVSDLEKDIVTIKYESRKRVLNDASVESVPQ